LKSNKVNSWLIAALCLSIMSVIGWVDFGLYLSNALGAVGVGLNAAISLIFTSFAIGSYIMWCKTRKISND